MSSIYSVSAALQAADRQQSYDQKVEDRVNLQAFITELTGRITAAEAKIVRVDEIIATLQASNETYLLEGVIGGKGNISTDLHHMRRDLQQAVVELEELDAEIANHPGNPANPANVTDLTQEDDQTACSEADPEDLEFVSEPGSDSESDSEWSQVIPLPTSSAGTCAPPRPLSEEVGESESEDEGKATYYMGPSTLGRPAFQISATSSLREDSDTEADDSFALDVELIPLRDAVQTHKQLPTVVHWPPDSPEAPAAAQPATPRVTRSKSKEAPAYNTRSAKRARK